MAYREFRKIDGIKIYREEIFEYFYHPHGLSRTVTNPSKEERKNYASNLYARNFNVPKESAYKALEYWLRDMRLRREGKITRFRGNLMGF